jgi:beta-glucosidase
MDRRVFPQGFVWGCATSSFQIEGAAHEDGRGESIWDRFSKADGGANIKDRSNGDVACDHYHRWREDLDLMKALGQKAYRFSVAWPRVLPAGRGPVSDKGLDFYSRLVDGLLERGITPYVTLYHWDLPQVLEDAGGWRNRDTASAFVELADVVSRRLGDRARHWITHNEPWCSSMVSHQKGVHAPGMRDWAAALTASHHLLLSHGLAVPVVRENCAGGEVGITLNLSPSIPASKSAEDYDAARHHDGYMNRWFLDPVIYLPRDWSSLVKAGDLKAISAQTDFLGVNYYNRHVARSDRIPEAENAPRTVFQAPPAEWTDIGWEVHAPGMFDVLLRVHLEYRPTKILVTENGASYSDGPDATGHVADARRVKFLRDHLFHMHRAIEAGAPVAGYFAWSLLDNYEWEHGYSQRFGLTWVDYATQKRTPKESALFYRKVIGDNAIGEG